MLRLRQRCFHEVMSFRRGALDVVRNETTEQRRSDRRLEPCDVMLHKERVYVTDEIVVRQGEWNLAMARGLVPTGVTYGNAAPGANSRTIMLTGARGLNVFRIAKNLLWSVTAKYTALPFPYILALELRITAASFTVMCLVGLIRKVMGKRFFAFRTST